MAVNLKPPTHLLPVAGVRLGSSCAKIKNWTRDDLLVMVLDEGSIVSGVFTRNAFCAPPVQLCRDRLASGSGIRGLLINAGNANAATGAEGLNTASRTSALLASSIGSSPESVLPFSTGVIGVQLPVDRIAAAIPVACENAKPDGWMSAMKAIMTTDTVPKGASRQVQTSQGLVTVTGIAKGVGMICPDMATMLAYVATDANLTREASDAALSSSAAHSFNCVTVDGDTSTNDACMLISTGKVGEQSVDTDHADYPGIVRAIHEVCVELAQAIVRDGEGATKFITIDVENAATESEARCVAYSVANSPLVKTAMFASDANWGRIVMAIGNAGVEGLSPDTVSVSMDDVQLIEAGQPHPDYREEDGSAVVSKAEFTIRIGLGRGQKSVRVWTCDLGYEYVKINAEYRT